MTVLKEEGTKAKYPVGNLVLLLTWMTTQIVEDEGAVRVDAATAGTEVLLMLRVAPADLDRLCDSSRGVMDAMRVLIQEVGGQHGYQCFVELGEPARMDRESLVK